MNTLLQWPPRLPSKPGVPGIVCPLCIDIIPYIPENPVVMGWRGAFQAQELQWIILHPA